MNAPGVAGHLRAAQTPGRSWIDGAAPESGPLSQRAGFRRFRVADLAAALEHVSARLGAGAPALTPAEVLEVVCEASAPHLSPINVVFFERVAGRARALAWSTPGASTESRMIARERAWSLAADLVEERRVRLEEGGEVACALVWDERHDLCAMLYVESRRRLDGHDRAFLGALLMRMLYLPEGGAG